ncbi:hypothetical protein HKO22_10295 [Peptoniphilus sp. AGMB00490]|uniref:Uncharacterized protein n=1 Tax=Peptoniphilus faecalis TaxID=2731255 RepID=A0A848RJD0_9FIRM|nr:hypothetical protein [Peptoniphilus faecalis]NMW86095.1 hypothetical protein [Peptoniphilus faecalis]
MGGLIIVVAIIVIVCYIMWRKNQNKNTPTAKKSIETKEKPSVEKVHKTEEIKNDDVIRKDDSVRNSKVKEENKYDASRKKDRAKKRREKRNSESKEIFEVPSEKTEDNKVEPKANVTKDKAKEPVKKVEPKADDSNNKTNEPAKKVEPKADDSNNKTSEPVKKVEPKDDDSINKISKPAKKIEPKADDSINKTNEPAKKFETKAEKVNSINEKYSHIINALGENPWDIDKGKISVKVEDIKTKKSLDAEEFENMDFKESLTVEKLIEFLNCVSTNPTILKRKENIIYDFTTKKEDEIKKIAKRYSLENYNFEKATSVLTVHKESSKILEITDILTSEEKRIYFETKF